MGGHVNIPAWRVRELLTAERQMWAAREVIVAQNNQINRLKREANDRGVEWCA